MASAIGNWSRRELVAWEVGILSAELTGAGLGLLLGFGLGDWYSGSAILIGVCALSFGVRFWHYGRLGQSRPDAEPGAAADGGGIGSF